MSDESDSTTTKVQGPKFVPPFRAWRLRRGLSQRQAALRLGVAPTVVRAIDDGAAPSLTNAARIVYGTEGELGYEDLLDVTVRARLRRQYTRTWRATQARTRPALPRGG